MWSVPRSISTALMRSFENRNDTNVLDEPLYAYYLFETKNKHPMSKEIISKYDTDINIIIKKITEKNHKSKIIYQKHMTHHILDKTPINWIKKGINCFLIRNPKNVINSYIKKNKLNNSNDIGFYNQYKLFNLIKNNNIDPIVINSEDLLKNPKKNIKMLCNKLQIPYSDKMIKWPKGSRKSDGIWGKIWYQKVKSSSGFESLKNKKINIPYEYNEIYYESLEIYNKLNSYNLLNE